MVEKEGKPKEVDPNRGSWPRRGAEVEDAKGGFEWRCRWRKVFDEGSGGGVFEGEEEGELEKKGERDKDARGGPRGSDKSDEVGGVEEVKWGR